jgi:DNA-binding beta-propeller fold protein YncE
MNSKRIVFLLFIFLFSTRAWPCHIDPQPLWTLKGFENPESAHYDPATNTIYVSNVAGDPRLKDGRGFISTVSPEGDNLILHWLDGFDAPKGIRVAHGKLYVTDLDRVVVIDVAKKKILRKIAVPGSSFLNDIAVDSKGVIYATDTLLNLVYSISPKGTVSKYFSGPAAAGPNGVLIDDDSMVLANWGTEIQPDFSVKSPGRLVKVKRRNKEVEVLTMKAVGNLDGLEKDNHGDWLASDWKTGKVYHIECNGNVRELLTTKPGAADIGFISSKSVVLIPQMNDNTLAAYYLR